jgi:peptidoglycan-N-acetylglucosamine deacetylase
MNSGTARRRMRKFGRGREMNPAVTVLGCAAVAGGAFAWGAMSPSAQLFGPTIRRTGKANAVGLTFDDGPNPRITPGLLDLLDRYQAHATFFLIGKHVRAFPGLAKEIGNRGHTIGNHTDTHPNLIFVSRERIISELERCDDAIRSATGDEAHWMRPPYGFRGPQLDGVVRNNGEGRVVMWSVSGYDWRPQPPEDLIRRLRRVQGGDIVLLHDGDHRELQGDRRHTVAALEHWLPRWKEAGLTLESLDEIRGSGIDNS